MRNLIRRGTALVLCAALLAGLGLFSVPSQASPETDQVLEGYIENQLGNDVLLVGEDNYINVTKSSGSGYQLDMGGVQAGEIGYMMADFDQDGQNELIRFSIAEDTYGISATVMEAENGYAVGKAGMDFSGYSELFTLKAPLNTIDDYSVSFIDMFAYIGKDGKMHFAVEAEFEGHAVVDSRQIAFGVFSYNGGTINCDAFTSFSGTDGYPGTQFMQTMEQLGIPVDWNRIFDFEASVGNYVDYYFNICRVEFSPIVTRAEADQYFASGSGAKRWTRVHYTMPSIRHIMSLTAETELHLEAMLRGITPTNTDYYMPTAWWTPELCLSYAYSELNRDLSDSMMMSGYYDFQYNMFNYGYNYGIMENGAYTGAHMYEKNVLPSIISSTIGRTFTFPPFAEITPGLFHDDNYLFVMPADGYGTEMTVDTLYEEGGHLFAAGSAYITAPNLEYLGRYTAEIKQDSSSMFGYTLVVMPGIEPPRRYTLVTSTASSYLPQEGTNVYSPDMLQDRRLDTAWNENAPGVGIGEWVRFYTDYGQMLITSIRIRNGYQKSDAVYEWNGKPTQIKVEFEDGTTITQYAWFDTCIRLDKPIWSDFVKITILDAETGAAYDDVCMSEVEIYTCMAPFFDLPAIGTNAPEYPLTGFMTDQMQYYSPYYSGSVDYSMVPSTAPSAPSTAPSTPSAPPTAPTSISTSDYILPESNTRLYTAAELSGLDKATLRLARNEIYARHGRRFNSADLQAYFDSKPWYNGTIAPANFDNNVLNSFELANIKLIESLE